MTMFRNAQVKLSCAQTTADALLCGELLPWLGVNFCASLHFTDVTLLWSTLHCYRQGAVIITVMRNGAPLLLGIQENNKAGQKTIAGKNNNRIQNKKVRTEWQTIQVEQERKTKDHSLMLSETEETHMKAGRRHQRIRDCKVVGRKLCSAAPLIDWSASAASPSHYFFFLKSLNATFHVFKACPGPSIPRIFCIWKDRATLTHDH